MREPGFRRRDEAAGILDAALLRQAADYLSGVRVPGQSERAFGKIHRAGEIEGRGEERLVLHFTGVDELRDGHEGDRGQLERVGGGGGIRVGERAVRGAEVDTDNEAWFHYSISTSAGAMTFMSCLPCKTGRSTLTQRQPL